MHIVRNKYLTGQRRNAQTKASRCGILTKSLWLAIKFSVYVERLLNYAEMDLCPSNWRRVVLGAIMLASKAASRVCEDRLHVKRSYSAERLHTEGRAPMVLS
ncbi:hypothetical protein TELCIR_05677 [Teladorsagia circumcincta]|uniref:Cyclin N-terminal domain-containing protein n=1 Tax=Teladorsagia circumcincta TaxID=45464 RepID=A0A2G9UQ63_TELCI|nr:hypothetical protein TELCIR_05677 [Teladorsagia circumcincta]